MKIGKILSNLFNIPKFGGDIWYVSKAGSDNNDGKRPDRAKLTIGAAITSSSAGDAINVKAGTYDENGLDLAANGLELWGEIGVLIVNTNPGTCLTVSGNSCRVRGIKVQQAGQIGFAITGAGCILEHCISEDNTVAFDIDGAGTVLQYCQDNDATVTGYDISNEHNVLYLCKSIAGGGASRGFYLSHTAAHENILYQCLSIGNGTAGYHVVSGADYNAFAYCVSGGKDGARLDLGANNTWSNFDIENKLHVVQTFAGGGGSSTQLFRVYGIVQIKFIYGIVETILNADVDNVSLDVFPAGGPLVPLATLVDSASAVAGSMFLKNKDATNALVLKSAATPFIAENTDWKEPFVTTVIGEEGDGTATYIRCTYSGVATSGAIDWHIEYEPLSDDGFIAVQ